MKYDLEATYSLDVSNLGYSRDISTEETIPYVSKVYDKNSWNNFATLDSELSNEGVIYYAFTSETWNNIAEYEPVVIITKEGEETEYRAQKVTGSNTRYEVEGTDPVIYYEEAGLLMGKNNEGAPIISSLVKIVPHHSSELLFVDTSKKTLNQMIDYKPSATTYRYDVNGEEYVSWNPALNGKALSYGGDMNDYIDYNLDGKYEFSSDVDNQEWIFTPDDLATKEFEMIHDPIVLPLVKRKVTSFKTFEYEGIADTTKYSISNDELFYDTSLTIFGTWHIPIEYGDFTVIESNTIPKIEEVELLPESLYEGEVATLKITSSVTGSNGPVTARIITTESVGHLSFSDKEDEKFIEIGNPQVFEFKITATDVVKNFDGSFKVELEGTTGIIDEKTINYGVKDTSEIEESDKVSIIVRAVDENGNFLNNEYPITVSQTGTTQYGTWNGIVIKDEIVITGEETNELVPQDKTITVTDSNTEFTLVYAGEGYIPPIDWTATFFTLLAIFVVIGLGFGVYLYYKESKFV